MDTLWCFVISPTSGSRPRRPLSRASAATICAPSAETPPLQTAWVERSEGNPIASNKNSFQLKTNKRRHTAENGPQHIDWNGLLAFGCCKRTNLVVFWYVIKVRHTRTHEMLDWAFCHVQFAKIFHAVDTEEVAASLESDRVRPLMIVLIIRLI